MEKIKLPVPADIRYISEWKDFDKYLPKEPFIMNKTITGCGYTEYCIRNIYNTIICSPRKVLLENKEDQHSDEENILYIKDEYATFQFDKDISKEDRKKQKGNKEGDPTKAQEYTIYIKNKIKDHIQRCHEIRKPVKILVTYDSFRRVKEALGESINGYRIIVDEFQSIFCDSRFKSDTENIFLDQLKDIKMVCYLSATPMMDEYLKMLDHFKDLPYYELDWEELKPGRVVRPQLKTKKVTNIVEEAKRIINLYQTGKYERITLLQDDGTFKEVYSKEAVIYINSVKNVCDIIKHCNLKLDETNVLCSDTDDNELAVFKAFKKVDPTITTKIKCIGTVPKKGEPHKMFTLCTRTVYLGADFYSTNARSFIFSDANVDCLSVDITLDLPQILGRQRLDENPWKNYAELYYKTNTRDIPQEKFKAQLDEKTQNTLSKLKAYNDTTEKHTLAVEYQRTTQTHKYKFDFVAVNTRGGSDIIPVFNKLVMIAEMRSFEIQQYDYKDRFSVFNAIGERTNIKDLDGLVSKLYEYQKTSDKYRFLCSIPESDALAILPLLPSNFQNYYTVLGKERMYALGFDVTRMKKEYDSIIGNQGIDIRSIIQGSFTIGERITKAEVKKRLGEIYDIAGYKKTPKAVDLGEYFIINTVDIKNEKTGKRDKGYLIVDIKKEDS